MKNTRKYLTVAQQTMKGTEQKPQVPSYCIKITRCKVVLYNYVRIMGNLDTVLINV